MYKICLILPYFGKLPNYFKYFLSSCGYNKTVDFLIFSDQEIHHDYENVKVVPSSWGDFKEYVKARFDCTVCLDTPYKLCDYKPAYGHIFADYLTNYDYWGHCDCDLIWGDLGVLQSKLSNKIDRYGEYGHLILYRNDSCVNQYFRELHSSKIPSWEIISHNSKNFGFDEFGGMNVLIEDNRIPEKKERLFDDIIFYRKNFFSRREIPGLKDNAKVPTFFSFKQGKLYRYYYLNSKWQCDESLYVHFQKRHISVENPNIDDFDIVPNRIVNASKMPLEELLSCTKAPLFDKAYLKMMLKYHVSNFVKSLKK